MTCIRQNPVHLAGIMDQTLIIGYGNPDRQDDGVAWHILCGLSQKLGYRIPVFFDDLSTPTSTNPHLLFALQLTPEHSEIISNYQRVCFIDAHTGNIQEDLACQNITPFFQSSPFTHHMTPQTCLSLAKTLHSAEPEAILVSVRGFEFGFAQSLSSRTKTLANRAINQIMNWINKN